jgi:hypothetical protein
MQSEKGRVTRNSTNKKELLTFIHMQSEKGRVTRNSMNEKEELLTFIHMQSEKGRVTRNSMNEKEVRMRAHTPGPSGSAAKSYIK